MEPVSYFLAGRRGILVKERLGAYDKAGRAETALGAAVSHPSHLNRMEIVDSSDTLNSCNFGIIGNSGNGQYAGSLDFTVHKHIAGSALSDSAADLTSCEQESVPQNGGKLFVAIAYESALYTVDVEHSFDRHLLVSS